MNTKTRSLLIDLGRDVSEYDTMTLEIPENASHEEIEKLIAEAVMEYACDDSDAFCNGEIGDTNGLRAVFIRDGNTGERIELDRSVVPVENQYFDIGIDVCTAIEHLAEGKITQEDFLNNVIETMEKNMVSRFPEGAKLKKPKPDNIEGDSEKKEEGEVA